MRQENGPGPHSMWPVLMVFCSRLMGAEAVVEGVEENSTAEVKPEFRQVGDCTSSLWPRLLSLNHNHERCVFLLPQFLRNERKGFWESERHFPMCPKTSCEQQKGTQLIVFILRGKSSNTFDIGGFGRSLSFCLPM